ncbi:MAG: hypothetical protein B7Y07_11650 [Halothiobacillus sp. 24-54-40]|nr:MAG: hypothetical protein B7Y53_03455 [Halothiobacillus sp. 28-55-5]OYZ85305.1 MAG: hypothetical protein B7Y07_11650 [Halothiobacillus sp. 24-54-40]
MNPWTPERRAKQAALIHQWQPWKRSTGAKTEAGKARSSQNASKPDSLRRKLKEINAQLRELKELRKLVK